MPFFQGQCRVPGAGVLRKAKAMPSSKFFIWLALLDRCWTGDRLLRHHPKDDSSCPLCSQVEETIDHLLLGGCYTREVWHHLLVRHGLLHCCSAPRDRVADWWHASRKKIARSSRKGFDSLMVLTWWSVWKERNHRTFSGAMQLAVELECRIREEGSLWVAAGAAPTLGLVL
jgi:hypothetical protein